MEKVGKREIYFFDQLAKSICEDAEALDALREYHHIGDIFRILKCFGYLPDMTKETYIEMALRAGDDLKYFLDSDTGTFSDDAVDGADEEKLKASFELHRNLILLLIGKVHGQPRFPLIVEVENGMVRGNLEHLHNVAQWYGIPYAAPATDANRWRKPQPAPSIERVMNCTKPGECNLQTVGRKTTGAEGRLTLNVCRPNSVEKGLPVVVYFHSGNFQFMTSTEWQGNKFCETVKAVHVSVNYRLGALGFNPLPALWTGDAEEDSGNFALLDVIAALRWVQRNIRAFGGDPDNVTICGFSAGGRAVTMLLISPLARGLFHRAICFSACLVFGKPEPSREIFAERFARLAVEDHVRDTQEDAETWLLSGDETDRKTARQWLCGLSAERVIGLFSLAGGRMVAFPHCFQDGTVIPKTGFDTPDMSHVPLMLFYSTDEFSGFVPIDPWFKQRQKAQTPEKPDETLEKDKAFARKYGSLIFGYRNSHQAAEQFYPHLGAPIYVGKFHYGHEARNFSEDYSQRYGALHGVFLTFLSDQYKVPWKKGNDFFEHTGAEYLGTLFLNYIGHFIESGDPNYNGEEAPWLAWTPEKRHELFFDGDRKRGYVKAGTNDLRFADVFAQFDADTSVSEESKAIIASRVLNQRIFSHEWDAHYGNAPDPTSIQ